MTYLPESLATEVRGREPLLRWQDWAWLTVLALEILAVLVLL